MTPTRLDGLIERYLKGEANATESSGIELWMDTMRKRRIHETDISRRDEENLFNAICSRQWSDDTEVTEFIPRYYKHRSFLERNKSSILLFVSVIFFLLSWWINVHRHSDTATTIKSTHQRFSQGSAGVHTIPPRAFFKTDSTTCS